MTLYEESVFWCDDYAKTHKLTYRCELDGNHKYFHSLKEAQDFLDNRFKEHRAIVTPKQGKDYIELDVQYVKI